MDYRYERGKVGNWNNREVWIVEKKDYEPHVDAVQVIVDDDMKMVQDGCVVGYLKPNGDVSQLSYKQRYVYKHRVMEESKPLPQKEKEEIEVRLPGIAIPAGYFEQFSSVVDEFFSSALQKT